MRSEAQRILIAEDEPRIAVFLENGLRANGFATRTVVDVRSAGEQVRTDRFDLLILDIGLPGEDGASVLDELQRWRQLLPVVLVSGRELTEQLFPQLEGGAVDPLPKPFRLDELLARIRIRLGGVEAEPTLLREGRLVLDLRTRRAMAGDHSADLTARESTLLETFLRHRGQVLSRAQLVADVWGYDFDPQSNVVDVYVGYLRRKLGERVIETVRGQGYRLPVLAAGQDD